MPIEKNDVSSYLQYLPAIYSEDDFLGRFLLAFEQVLTGLEGADGEPAMGLEQTIAQLALLFDPQQTREEFLPWLSGWVALSLRADWNTEQKRDFLADIVPLYRRRGTKENLAELLRIYLAGKPEIDDGVGSEFQIGVSRIGVDTRIFPPHFFSVKITDAKVVTEAEINRREQIARALIDLQKPAHTAYSLRFSFATMKIARRDGEKIIGRSTIGKDTLIGIQALDEDES